MTLAAIIVGIAMLLLLPETRGREIASLQSAMGAANP